MKILFVIDSLGSGGAQNQLTLLARAMVEEGHSIHFLSYFKDDFFADRLTATSIEHHFVQKKGKLGLNIILKLKQLYETEQYAGVLSYLDTPNFYAIAAGKIARHKPFSVISYRSHTDFDNISSFELIRKKWLNAAADAIVTNSHHEKANWRKADKKNADKWSTIYNLVDLEKFCPKPIKNFPAIFIGIGKVRPLKNIDLILDALLLLRQQKKNLPIIHWYGERLLNNALGATVKSLEEKIINNNLQNHFLWKDAVTNLHEIIPDYGALIHPSLLEGLPNVVCEALACGLPVIISDLFDHPILVEQKKRGYLVNPKSPVELAEAMNQIMQPLVNKSMATNAREYAQSAFSKHNGVQQYLNIFKQD